MCPEPVWFGFSGGSTSGRSGSTVCAKDSDCYEGAACI